MVSVPNDAYLVQVRGTEWLVRFPEGPLNADDLQRAIESYIGFFPPGGLTMLFVNGSLAKPGIVELGSTVRCIAHWGDGVLRDEKGFTELWEHDRRARGGGRNWTPLISLHVCCCFGTSQLRRTRLRW